MSHSHSHLRLTGTVLHAIILYYRYLPTIPTCTPALFILHLFLTPTSLQHSTAHNSLFTSCLHLVYIISQARLPRLKARRICLCFYQHNTYQHLYTHIAPPRLASLRLASHLHHLAAPYITSTSAFTYIYGYTYSPPPLQQKQTQDNVSQSWKHISR